MSISEGHFVWIERMRNAHGQANQNERDKKRQYKQLIPLATYGEADRSNGCEIRTQRAAREMPLCDWGLIL